MDDLYFIGDWIKDRILGSGSFGIVALWKHKKTDETLAIKVCKWGPELTNKHKERWTKEVEMLQNCNNRNIVATKPLPDEFKVGLASANPSNLPVLCMEYCSGGDLRQLLNKPEACSGLKEMQICQILGDIRNALEFLHSNKITHRDLKPENIVMQIVDSFNMFNPSNQKKVIYKLIDLGYAKEIDSNSVCASFVGTLQYLAPEILYSKTYSNSVDFWSLGLLAFEMICGVRPFLPNMAPVQWMPHVKKKLTEHICVYETYHGDIEYSSELFPENHISAPLKALIENWLKVALEWDPKIRGRDAPSKVTFNLPTGEKDVSSKVVIFNLLEDILNRKIIKVFSVPTQKTLSFEFFPSTTVSLLKTWINEETNIPVSDLILISQLSYTELEDEDIITKYWRENGNISMYLFDKTILIKDSIEPFVPKAVKRSLEHPKSLYNFNNSQDLYRAGIFLVMSQIDIYDSFITALFVRSESIKQESKQLLLKHNAVDKSIGKLKTKQDTVQNIIDIGKKHIEHIKKNGTGSTFLGGFEKLFKEHDELTNKVKKLQNAWSQLTVRLQSAARRSNDVSSTELNEFVSKYNYQSIFVAAQKAYSLFKKNAKEYRIKEKQCHDIMKICYDCLKQRSKVLIEIKHQPFVLKLLDLNVEFSKINEIISTASENVEKLIMDLTMSADELTNCMWSTISILCGDVENLNDLPYSVISFEKKDFKVGEPVSPHNSKSPDISDGDTQFRSLIEESIKLRQSHSQLAKKLKSKQKIISDCEFDFSFIRD